MIMEFYKPFRVLSLFYIHTHNSSCISTLPTNLFYLYSFSFLSFFLVRFSTWCEITGELKSVRLSPRAMLDWLIPSMPLVSPPPPPHFTVKRIRSLIHNKCYIIVQYETTKKPSHKLPSFSSLFFTLLSGPFVKNALSMVICAEASLPFFSLH